VRERSLSFAKPIFGTPRKPLPESAFPAFTFRTAFLKQPIRGGLGGGRAAHRKTQKKRPGKPGRSDPQ
jgi:hypothetical protein